jgi:hypothetical protein
VVRRDQPSVEGVRRAPSALGVAAGTGRPDTLGDILSACLGWLTSGPFRRTVTRALALTPRGFVPHDVLVLNALSARLQVEWRSRDIHPWDHNLSPERRAERFRNQTLCDTDAAVMRLFTLLPEVDAIEIRVLAPLPSSLPILAGTVVRDEALAARSIASPAMRLRMMGMRCRMQHGRFEPLD